MTLMTVRGSTAGVAALVALVLPGRLTPSAFAVPPPTATTPAMAASATATVIIRVFTRCSSSRSVLSRSVRTDGNTTGGYNEGESDGAESFNAVAAGYR